MELSPDILGFLLPILGRYECLVGSLGVVCKFFPYMDA